jgi:hypothetical protein
VDGWRASKVVVLPLEEQAKLIAYVQRNKKDMTDLRERAHRQWSRPFLEEPSMTAALAFVVAL